MHSFGTGVSGKGQISNSNINCTNIDESLYAYQWVKTLTVMTWQYDYSTDVFQFN